MGEAENLDYEQTGSLFKYPKWFRDTMAKICKLVPVVEPVCRNSSIIGIGSGKSTTKHRRMGTSRVYVELGKGSSSA